MSLDILKQRLKSNKPCGTYLFYGKEEYTKDFYVRELRKKVTVSPLPEFNHIIFDAEKSDSSEFSEAAFSLPYMWDFKLIEIKNFNLTALTQEEAEEYTKVISELPDYVILLFMFRSEELDDSVVEGGFSGAKTKNNTPSESEESSDDSGTPTAQKGSAKGMRTLINALKKYGLAVNFPNETGEKLENWIIKHFMAKKVTIEHTAVQTLVTLCGNDMYTLHSEIEKLLNSEASARAVNQADVLQYCCPNENYKIYELSDALSNSDMKKVKQIFDNLAINKTDPSMMLGYLSKMYSDMLLIQSALDEGKSLGKIAQSIKKSEWLVRRTVSGLSKKPSGYIAFACDCIDVADRKLKRFSVNPYIVLEIMLFRIGLYGRK